MTSKLTRTNAHALMYNPCGESDLAFTQRIFDAGYQEALKDMQALVDHAEALTINTARERNK